MALRGARRALAMGVIGGGAEPGINVTTFTQALGNEALTNPSFTAWTGDNPDGWGVVGESGSDPMVTQVASGGGAGTGAARLYSSATANRPYIQQTVLSVGTMYEIVTIISALTGATSLGLQDGGGGFQVTTNSVGPSYAMVRAGHALFYASNREAPSDIIVDSISIKPLTLNAVVTATADGTFQFEFTLPASPVPGQCTSIRYRVVDTLNYWVASLARAASDWTFNLSKSVAGTITSKINVTGITGTPTLLKTVTSGNDHIAFTGTGSIASPTYTQRGGTITDAALATATGVTTVYSSPVTPVKMRMT